MAIVITDDKHYTDIAAAIRGKNGEETTYKPSEMAAAIEAITGGEKISELTIYEASNAFVVNYADGTTTTGSATFDENGLATALTDDDGNSVNFTSGYPTSATDSEGHSIVIMWG